MYSLFQGGQKLLSDANYFIYFAYFILLIIIFNVYRNGSSFNREERTDYEYDGVIPKNNRKVIVYSCLIGDYDNVSTFNKQRGFDYILFTDQKINNTNWTIFPIPDEVLKLNVSDIKKQRYMKINPHKFFKNYDLSLYLDANYIIQGDLNDYLINTLNPIDHIFIPHLQFGKGIKQAIKNAIDKKLDNATLLNEVMDRYNKSKVLDKTGIVNAGLIIRKHHTKDCIKLMEKWWEEVRDYSHVDGFAFDYAGYMTGVRYLYTSYQFALFYFNKTKHLKKIDY
jgi:hypothetical protein